MNILTKLWRDVTSQYVYKTHKEKRYKANITLRRTSIGSTIVAPCILRDLADNNEFYEVLSVTFDGPVYGIDAPIRKTNTKIEIISTYEVEIKEKVYY